MFKRLFFLILIFGTISCTDKSNSFDYELNLILEKGSGSYLTLIPEGDFSLDNLVFTVNDSVLSANVNPRNETYYSVDLQVFSAMRDGTPETAIISYNNTESVIYFTIETCNPRRLTPFYVEPIDDDEFLLEWKTCDELESDFGNLTLNTDYSIVELRTQHVKVFDNYNVIKSLDTTFVVLTDSSYISKEFYPRVIGSDTSTVAVRTFVKVTNVQGPLPDQKRYVHNQKLPILFYDRTSASGGIEVLNR